MSPSESVGDAKTVRACDCCLRCRARWYCAAADAFLCHPCDTSVHAANPLTRRHEHVRLRTASSGIDDVDNDGPTWHHRCKRKARSPRGPHRVSQSKDKDADEKGRGVAAAVAAGPPETMVPDIMEQLAPVEEEEQLLYRVPTLKPMLSEFYSPPPSSSEDNEKPPILPRSTHQTPVDGPTVDLLLPSGIDLAGFDVDVESLFGEGLAEDAFSLEYFLSPVESHKDSGGCEGSFVPVKQEEGVDDDEGSSAVNSRFEAETIGVRFNCGTEEEEKPKRTVARDCGDAKRRRRSIMLSLNYEAVISAWSTQGCPWADGTRPQLNPDDCWPDYTGSILGAKIEGGRGEANIEVYQSGHALVPNGGREARVSRYREKRRTRLFSKKIRYEVRKLNAEKRPRMKGRFVKRSSFMATTTSPSRSRNSSSNSRS